MNNTNLGQRSDCTSFSRTRTHASTLTHTHTQIYAHILLVNLDTCNVCMYANAIIIGTAASMHGPPSPSTRPLCTQPVTWVCPASSKSPARSPKSSTFRTRTVPPRPAPMPTRFVCYSLVVIDLLLYVWSTYPVGCTQWSLNVWSQLTTGRWVVLCSAAFISLGSFCSDFVFSLFSPLTVDDVRLCYVHRNTCAVNAASVQGPPS